VDKRQRAKMLRFLSRRRARSVSGQTTSSQIKNQRLPSNKNVVQCRVVLLDGTDLPIELSVSTDRKKRMERNMSLMAQHVIML